MTGRYTNYLIGCSSSELLSSDSSSSSAMSWPGLYGTFLDDSVLAAALCPVEAVDWVLVLLAIDVGRLGDWPWPAVLLGGGIDLAALAVLENNAIQPIPGCFPVLFFISTLTTSEPFESVGDRSSRLLGRSLVWRSLWDLRVPCGFSPVWIFKCLFKLEDWLKLLVQNLHLNGRSPVCVHMWVVRWHVELNCFSQILHWCSPVCDRIWAVRLHSKPNCFLQMLHWCSFSPMCIKWWYRRVDLSVKRFLQTLHSYGRSPPCARKWFWRLHSWLPVLVKKLHW